MVRESHWTWVFVPVMIGIGYGWNSYFVKRWWNPDANKNSGLSGPTISK